MPRLLLFIPLALFVVLGGFLWKGLSLDPNAMPSALVGKPFPTFKSASLQDPERLLSNADFAGQPVLVNVWATWCPSCRQEHSDLMAIAAEKKLPLIGIDYKDERPAATAWLAELGNPYLHTIFDEQGLLGLDLGVFGAPETYFVDAKGIVRFRHVGGITPEAWQKIQELLNAN